MNKSSTTNPEAEWRVLREEAHRLNNIVIALRAGDEIAAFAAIDAPDQTIPTQRHRIAIPPVKAAVR